MKVNSPSKRKREDKEKEKRIEKPRNFSLKPEQGLRGIWRKPLQPGAVTQLVGSH